MMEQPADGDLLLIAAGQVLRQLVLVGYFDFQAVDILGKPGALGLAGYKAPARPVPHIWQRKVFPGRQPQNQSLGLSVFCEQTNAVSYGIQR